MYHAFQNAEKIASLSITDMQMVQCSMPMGENKWQDIPKLYSRMQLIAVTVPQSALLPSLDIEASMVRSPSQVLSVIDKRLKAESRAGLTADQLAELRETEDEEEDEQSNPVKQPFSTRGAVNIRQSTLRLGYGTIDFATRFQELVVKCMDETIALQRDSNQQRHAKRLETQAKSEQPEHITAADELLRPSEDTAVGANALVVREHSLVPIYQSAASETALASRLDQRAHAGQAKLDPLSEVSKKDADEAIAVQRALFDLQRFGEMQVSFTYDRIRRSSWGNATNSA